MHLTMHVVRLKGTKYQDCDLLDSAEEPHPISLSEHQGAAPLVFRVEGQLPPQPPWFLRPCSCSYTNS